MIVLDTHALVWFVDGADELSAKAHRKILESLEQDQVMVSSISAWEIHMLAQRKRLQFSVSSAVWIRNVEDTQCFQFVPVDNSIAHLSTTLNMHGDPADRFIAATTLKFGATLISRDKKLAKLKQVKTLW